MSSIWDICLAIIEIESRERSKFLGTATVLPGHSNCLVTCRHVIEKIDKGNLKLYRDDPDNLIAISDIKFINNHDIAFIEVENMNIDKSNLIELKEPEMGDEYKACGFTHRSETSLVIEPRCFHGNIVRVITNSQPTQPSKCEMSNYFPKGMSGGPVYKKQPTSKGKYLLHGIICGNAETQISVPYENYQYHDQNEKVTENKVIIQAYGLMYAISKNFLRENLNF